MKICAISDLHGYLPELNPCDLILIAGDVVPLNIQRYSDDSLKWFKETFRKWAENLPCDKVIFIAGNHDFYCERHPEVMHNLFGRGEKVTYLEDELYTYLSTEGEVITIYGTPLCHQFGNWAFMREPETLDEKFANIPENVDILLTHDAPYGVSDVCLQRDVWWASDKHIGNMQLRNAILEKNPVLNLHGHLHSTNHMVEYLEKTAVYNVSLKDERYEVIYLPYYFVYPNR